MGEMTIRGIDDGTLAALRHEAERRGMDPSDYAGILLREALPARADEGRPGDRAAVARSILATQPEPAKTESVIFLREDRSRR
jgi:plasmid stability protein